MKQLFDHPVGAGKQCRRNLYFENPGGLEVDDQLNSGRLFDGQIGGIRSIQNLSDEIARSTKRFIDRRAIADEATGFHDQRARRKQRKPMRPCLRGDAIPQVTNPGIPDDLKRIRVLCHERRKQRIKIVSRFERDGHRLQSDGSRLVPEIFHNHRVGWI